MRTAKCYTAASCQSRPLTYASPGTSRPGAERTLHSCVVTAVLTENSSAPGAHSVLPVHLPNSAGLQPPCVGLVSLLNVRSTNLTFSKSHQPAILYCVCGEEPTEDAHHRRAPRAAGGHPRISHRPSGNTPSPPHPVLPLKTNENQKTTKTLILFRDKYRLTKR